MVKVIVLMSTYNGSKYLEEQTVYISFVFSAAIVISQGVSVLLGNFLGINAFVSVSWINEVFCTIILMVTYYLKARHFPPSIFDA